MKWFGVNTTEHDDHTVEINTHDKLESLSEYPLTTLSLRKTVKYLNTFEEPSFSSMNNSLCWLASASSSICYVY